MKEAKNNVKKKVDCNIRQKERLLKMARNQYKTLSKKEKSIKESMLEIDVRRCLMKTKKERIHEKYSN